MKNKFFLNQLYHCNVIYNIGRSCKFIDSCVFTSSLEARLYLSMFRYIPGCVISCSMDSMQVLNRCDSPYNFVNSGFYYDE